MRNKRFPNFPDDADYNTNAPSYYEDLARKEKLIKLLSKRIWEYDEELAKRFDEWDKNLEDFPEEVKNLLQQWLDNGTLDHIINDTIFNWKLDTEIFEQFRDATTAQLQQKTDKTFVNSEIERLDQKDITLTDQLDQTNQTVNEHNQKINNQTNTNRSVIMYRDATTVRVIGRSYQMLGFRFFNNYLKNSGAFVSTENTSNVVSTINNLGAETVVSNKNWYGVFAVKKENGDLDFKIMPFLRIRENNNGVLSFGEDGELSNYQTPKAYTFQTDQLNDCDVLIINEKIANRSNSFSGRVSKVIANNTNTLTVLDSGTIEGIGEYVLVSPPGYSEYRYVGSFYQDTAEVRNIADDGINIRTRGVRIPNISIDGKLDGGVYVDLSGYISPLATGVYFYLQQSFSTATTGTAYVYWGLDNAHDFYVSVVRKDIETTLTTFDHGIQMPFGYRGRQIAIRTGGTIDTYATRQIHIRGHQE